ncbi:carbohydrate-binding module family 48 protein [Dothidotthia symphoricarpi CBS 119687]|uniref:Carbohydrate-binding module family 48 protein n=1 Tax=Dothidotthia symphoricarpi CBS 119687 TaxID=1392245 RepID=A0A6A6ASN7_9PLEO|nr:carbohydrate-binding module family 48 protein [Dothidotthia symphoricarpi CBS 119687]KAF2133867.1 carbohydrate-binding module family 48 protein [Dothidotthia symphoricarpi CBS 119687]
MGKYTFTWEHAAHDVYVTGTFDDWRKTIKLEKEDGIFKKTVSLPKVKTQYKFVVNGAWCTNDTAAKEDDGQGMVNNVLQPHDIVDEPVNAFQSTAPQSSTAALAGAVPRESERMSNLDKARSQDSIPGAFPMTPAAETPGTAPRTFDISPLPATSGLGNPIQLAPGEPVPHPSTFTDNTVNSTVRHREEPEMEEKVSVAPIPASTGLGNPIHLAPGEKVPDASTLTPHTVQSTVNTDFDSYNKADSRPPQLELGLTPTAEREAKGGMFGLPPVSEGLVPESSLPMGADAVLEKDTGVTVQSAAPLSSTAALAGQVPKEPRAVPEAVAESRKEAGFAPEATANTEAVLEKKDVEQELLEKVPQAPVTADDTTATVNNVTSNIGTAASTVAGAATAGIIAGAGLFASAAYTAKEQAAQAVGLDKSAPVGDVAYAAKDRAVDAVGLDSSATATDNAYLAKDKTLANAVAAKDQTAAAANVATENAYLAKDKAVESAVAAKDQTVSAANVATENAYLAKDKAVESVGLDKSASAADNAYLAKDKAVESVGLDSSRSATDNAFLAKDKAVDAAGLNNSGSATDNAYLAKDKAAHAVGLNDSTSSPISEGVPAIVSESQREAHASPEASLNPEAVAEKGQFEQELLSQVPKTNHHGESAPAVAVPEIVSESLREAHASPEAAANVEAVAEKKAFESELLREIPKANETGESAPVIAVPAIVSESQKEAHVGPEAAANPEAVYEKKALESQLLSEVPKTTESGESAPSIKPSNIPGAGLVAGISAGLGSVFGSAFGSTPAAAPAEKSVDVARDVPAEESVDVARDVPAENNMGVARDVPEVVAESQKEAHVDPEAAANAEAVSEKKSVENELLQEVKKVTSSGESAPTIATPSTSSASHSDPASTIRAVSPYANPTSPTAALYSDPTKPLEFTSDLSVLDAPASAPIPFIQPTASDDLNSKTVTIPEETKPVATTGTETTSDDSGLNAPASAPAQPETAQRIEPTTSVDFNGKKPATPEQTEPVVTTGLDTTPVPRATNASLDAPRSDMRKDSDVSPRGTPGSQSIASGTDDKKKNKRRSFFGKIKDKFNKN